MTVADGTPVPAVRVGLGRRLVVALPLVLFLALAGAFFVRLYSGADTQALPSVLIGRKVPAFALPPIEGLRRGPDAVPGFDAAWLATGQPTIVNVFASWCGPCHVEHPLLMEMAAKSGVRIAGINNKDEPENARRFLGAKGNPYVVAGADRAGRAVIDWGVYGMPETFVVGGDGTILHKHVGQLTPEAALKIVEIAKAGRIPGR